jgi:hypothetical protein
MPVIWKSWLQLLLTLAFVALGAWMLVDAFLDPAGMKTGQMWAALAIVVMFAGAAAIFAYELAARRRVGERTVGAAGHGPALWQGRSSRSIRMSGPLSPSPDASPLPSPAS